MSFQITILKVLAGHPEGRASLADLKLYMEVLACSGADWSERMKRLAARAPDLDIFSSKYVLRELTGWHITKAGRAFLASLEAPPKSVPSVSGPSLVELARMVQPAAAEVVSNVISIEGHKVNRRRRAAA